MLVVSESGSQILGRFTPYDLAGEGLGQRLNPQDRGPTGESAVFSISTGSGISSLNVIATCTV